MAISAQIGLQVERWLHATKLKGSRTCSCILLMHTDDLAVCKHCEPYSALSNEQNVPAYSPVFGGVGLAPGTAQRATFVGTDWMSCC